MLNSMESELKQKSSVNYIHYVTFLVTQWLMCYIKLEKTLYKEKNDKLVHIR